MQDIPYIAVFRWEIVALTALLIALRDKLSPRRNIPAEEREPISPVNDPVVDFVRRQMPSLDVESEERQEHAVSQRSYHIKLPSPVGADYQFTLWLGNDKKQITARLLANPQTAYFWCMPFKEVAFRSGSELNKAFIEVADQIMRHQTRIEQKRGFFSDHFKCEFKSAGGWKTVYGHSVPRRIRAPIILSRKQLYQSPPLIADALEQLHKFLSQLRNARIPFELKCVREAITVNLRSASTYSEIEFFGDGHIRAQTLGAASQVQPPSLQEIAERVIRDVNGELHTTPRQ